MRIDLTWTQFKTHVNKIGLIMQYLDLDNTYQVFAQDSKIIYVTVLVKESGNSDTADFEDNYKQDVPACPMSEEGKMYVRAESRPIDCTTIFTCAGDSQNNIGDGTEFSWDFSNDDNEIPMPSGSGLKRKRIEFSFLDSINIKEGAIYYHNAPKGAYIDLYTVCPAGHYYFDNNGNIQLATEDIPVGHFVCHHLMIGTVAMGDELNTESCSGAIPSNYKFWIEVTVPDTDEESCGFASLELYRKRTVVL